MIGGVQGLPVSGPLDRSRALPWMTGAAVLALALAARLAFPAGQGAFIDEYFHLLAARALEQDGTLLLAGAESERPYERAVLFSWLVAGSFELFGDSVTSGRLPSLAMGILLPLAVAWLAALIVGSPSSARAERTAARATALAAGGAGLLAALSLELVAHSWFARFYMMQTLGTTTLMIGLLLATGAGRRPAPILGGLLALLSAGVMLHVQITSVFAILPCLAWFAVLEGWKRRGALPSTVAEPLGKHPGTAAALTLALIGLLAWLAFSALEDPLRRLWSEYRLTQPWGDRNADDASFYLRWFESRFGWMSWGYPLAAALGLRWRGTRAALPVLCALGVLALASLGGQKAERYVLFALPAFLTTWAIAAAWIVDRTLERSRTLPPLPGTALAFVVLLAACYGLYRSPSYYNLGRAILTQEPRHPYNWPDYDALARELPVLRTRSAGACTLVNSSPPFLYHLGAFDVILNRSALTRFVDASGQERFEQEFSSDWRTGRPVISTVASLTTVLDGCPEAWIVVDESAWRTDGHVPAATADRIEAVAEPVASERWGAWRIMVFHYPREGASTAIAGSGKREEHP